MRLAAALLLLFTAATAFGQAGPAPASNPPSSILPTFDPGAEVATWDGQSWNITNHRLFESRFERYLSTPSDTNLDTTEHFKVLSRIRELLAPAHTSVQSREEAFRLLEQASDYRADDMLSDAIANQVYSAWLAQKNTALLHSATANLEKEKKRLEWNLRLAAGGTGLDQAPATSPQPGAQTHTTPPDERHALEMQQITARLAELNALLRMNHAREELSELQARTEFQVLIVQLFLQRRFMHVLIATRFYRAIFADGSSQQIHFGEEAQSLFAKTLGHTPTLTSLESISGEMISEAHDGANAFRTLLAEKEMESATQRLSEAFLLGEYLTPLDVVSMPDKHQALVFLHRSRQLLRALDVKDYTLAEKLVADLQATAKDYDLSHANTAIQTAKTISTMHLAKARNAALEGDRATQEAELTAATALWPTNPALAEVAAGIYSQANVHARAQADFDRLVSQRSWRQIHDERLRFIPALAADPDRQARLQQILDNIATIDRTIASAQDFEKRGEPAGAWETTELVARQFPEEYPRLAKYRGTLSIPAADYIQAITTAERLEQTGELGSALTSYLQAQAIYPRGELAKAGIQRLNHLILPDSW